MDSPGDGRPATAQGEGFPILVFKHAGWRFGVAVDHVEAIVGLPPPAAAGEPARCEYQGQELPAQTLGAWLGLQDGDGWQPSRVLIVRAPEHGGGGGGALRAFLVDAPRDIVTLPLEAVYPMPVLMARALGASPFWGVGHDRHNDELVLLVDLGAAARGAGGAPGAEAGSRGEGS